QIFPPTPILLGTDYFVSNTQYLRRICLFLKSMVPNFPTSANIIKQNKLSLKKVMLNVAFCNLNYAPIR
ncbi:hypothetical protein GIB67_023678, partial [Kingdonia uniflora]